jgi:hypothetical protein
MPHLHWKRPPTRDFVFPRPMRKKGMTVIIAKQKVVKKATVSGNPSLISQRSKQTRPITLATVSILKGK